MRRVDARVRHGATAAAARGTACGEGCVPHGGARRPTCDATAQRNKSPPPPQRLVPGAPGPNGEGLAGRADAASAPARAGREFRKCGSHALPVGFCSRRKALLGKRRGNRSFLSKNLLNFYFSSCQNSKLGFCFKKRPESTFSVFFLKPFVHFYFKIKKAPYIFTLIFF